jgi:hypothetical protein
MPNTPAVNPTTNYNGLSGNQPLSLIDASYLAAYNAINNLNQYANYFVDAGAVNAYTAGSLPAGLSFTYADGVQLQIKAANTNTGATTLNAFGSGIKTIVTSGGSALLGGEIVANQIFVVQAVGGGWQLLASEQATVTQPTTQVLTSGFGATYTRPANVKSIRVRLAGAGGGGSGNAGGAGTGGGTTSFGTLSANGGGGATGSGGSGGAGGSASGGDINLKGGGGGGSHNNALAGNTPAGGVGGASAFGGGGAGGGGSAGGAGAANTGGGGGGGSATDGTASGGGGGSGGYCEERINSPAATYTYTVGTGGAGSAGATYAGGRGGDGIIIVEEFYV